MTRNYRGMKIEIRKWKILSPPMPSPSRQMPLADGQEEVAESGFCHLNKRTHSE